MKKIVYMLLLSALLIMTGCKDAGVSIPDATTVDAATEAKITEATGKVLNAASTALSSVQSSGAESTGAGRTVYSKSIPETVVAPNITASGNYSMDSVSGEFVYNLDIKFTNYNNGTTSLDGTIGYKYEGNTSDSSTPFNATVTGDIKAIIDSVTYNLSFDIKTTMSTNPYSITVDGWVQTDDGYVIYNKSTSF